MFTKGQPVTLFQSWDGKGTVSIYQAVVYSCGKKQMVLCNEAGEKHAGTFYRPEIKQIQRGFEVHPRMSNEAAEAKALEIGAEVVAYEVERINRCLAGGHGEGYDRAMRKDLAALHEPRARWGEWKHGTAL